MAEAKMGHLRNVNALKRESCGSILTITLIVDRYITKITENLNQLSCIQIQFFSLYDFIKKIRPINKTVKSAKPLKKISKKGSANGIYFSNIFNAGII